MYIHICKQALLECVYVQYIWMYVHSDTHIHVLIKRFSSRQQCWWRCSCVGGGRGSLFSFLRHSPRALGRSQTKGGDWAFWMARAAAGASHLFPSNRHNMHEGSSAPVALNRTPLKKPYFDPKNRKRKWEAGRGGSVFVSMIIIYSWINH